MSYLDTLDLTKSLSKKEYNDQLEDLDLKLLKSQLKIRDKDKKVLILFEGWDAAGKGGAIKRLTEPLDPRGYKVHQISAPSEMEKRRHYLWRFWTRVPSNGEIVIFDRTWYGRVLVERVEHFATDEEWHRAYKEIKHTEKTFVDDNTTIIKIFIHISKDEQARRFEDRKDNPLKKYKIGKDDYRNRDKWDEYLKAYEDMFEQTNFDFAPWHIVEGNDKKYVRTKIMEIVIESLKNI